MAIVLTSCSDPRSSGHRRISIPAPPPEEKAGEFWLFADSQIHNAAGAATRSKSGTADAKAPTAIRPPSVDLWAEVVLANVSERMHGEAPEIPAFFLGDAANVSCIDEYVRFLDATGDKLPWFGVMGNHDGYYMGNFTFEPRGATGSNSWQGACAIDGVSRHPSWDIKPRLDRLERDLWKVGRSEQTHVDQGVLTKAHAIWMYLEHLQRRGIITRDPLACDNWVPLELDQAGSGPTFRCSGWKPSSGSSRVFRAKGSYRLGNEVRALSLVAYIDSATALSQQRMQPWHSYLVQDIELLDRNHAILIDTSDYLNAPPSYLQAIAKGLAEVKLSPSCWKRSLDVSLPGHCGEVNKGQEYEIERLLQEARGAHPHMRYFLLGHHPWQSFRRDTVELLKRLIKREEGFITYLSAHKHLSTATLGTDAKYHWEVNVAATTDWPMQFAKISYWLPSQQPRRPALQIDIRNVVKSLFGTCPYAVPGDPGTERHVDREMSYAKPEAYVARALEAYGEILAAIVSGDPTSGTQQKCLIDGRQVSLDEIRKLLNNDGAQPAKTLSEQRLLLDQLSRCDRAVLRKLPGVPEMEIDCAAWASKLEFDKNVEAERIRLSDHGPETFHVLDVPHPDRKP